MSRRNKTGAQRNPSRPRIDKALSPTTMQFAGAQPRGLQPRRYALMDAINTATARLAASGLAGTFDPLPRDPLDTTAFGPLSPMSPDPIDPIRSDTRRPEPRVFEYQNGWNLPGAGGRETPWQVLRAASDGVSIIRTCIEVRKRHIRALKWEIAPAKEAVQSAYEADQTRGQDSIEADMRSRLLAEINRLREFMKKPWHSNDWRLGQWLNAIVEDVLVLDGTAVYPRMNYGGQVLDLEVLDAATIKLLLDWRGARPQKPYAAFQQILYGFPRGEWTASTTRDEQGNEIVENGFAAGELFYYRENVRSFTPYGFPPVERALQDSRLWLKRFGWLLAEYDDGSTPLTFLETSEAADGSRMDVNQRRLYEDAINDELVGQFGKRHRMKVLPAGWQPHQMTTAPERYQPDYDLFIIKLIASHFGVTIAELGFTDAGAGLGAAGWHEGQAEVSGRVGLRPDVEVLSDLINSLLREFLLMSPELEFRFIDPAGQNDKDSDGVADAQVKSGRATLNDDRRRLGLSLYDFAEADMPMIITATGPVFLEGSFQRAQEAAQAAKEQTLAGADAARGKLEIEGAKLEDGKEARKEGLELERERMDRAEVTDAQKMAELGAFRTWRRRNPDPRRPFVFKSITPDDGFADIEGLTPDVVDFGPDWQWLIEVLDKGAMTWLEWNAAHPNRPRDAKGRWVKSGSTLMDALQREGARLKTGEVYQLPRAFTRLPSDGSSSNVEGMSRRKAAVPDDFESGAPDLAGDTDPKAQAPIPPDQRWPGWAVDTAIAAAVAPMLMAAVSAGTRVGALMSLLKDWLGGLGRRSGDPLPDVRSWLDTGTDMKDRLLEEIVPPIRQAHVEGWMVGQTSASALMDWVQEHQESARNAVDLSVNWGEWEPGHPEAARLLITPGGLGRLLAQSNVQIKSIVDHRLDEIGKIIGKGLQHGDSPDTIAVQLRQLVNNANWAKMTAITETARAMSAASVEEYRRGGCWGKGWMTAYDQRVCPACRLNEEMPDGSPRVVPIDGLFPSGDPWPPGHPRCRCAPIPVFELTRGR